MTFPDSPSPRVAVIGGGPAGLMAAEVLIQGGVQVDVYDAMPSVGRKFLLAGKGGLNITHSEPLAPFVSRYGVRAPHIAPLLQQFGPDALREWVHALGIATFIGSSGRVFPAEMKAAPLLRTWLHQLRDAGVRFHMRHRWQGWARHAAGIRQRFATPQGEITVCSDATVFALGGGSWARLGSDGAWVPLFARQGVPVAALAPSNCGFDIGWSDYFRTRFAGHPLQTIALSCSDASGNRLVRQGQCVITDTGIEGSLVYALSAALRDAIAAHGSTTVHIDLAPGKSLQRVIDEVAHPRGSRSLASHLQSRVGITGVKAGLLRECMPKEDMQNPQRLAQAIKALPLRLAAPRPIDEAISSAGGVPFEALDARLMLRTYPGLFCAGEMLDWEAPTGGYLLTACFASGRVAAHGVLQWLCEQNIDKTGVHDEHF